MPSDRQTLINNSKAAIQSGDIQKAESICIHLLSVEPNNSYALAMMAIVHFLNKKYFLSAIFLESAKNSKSWNDEISQFTDMFFNPKPIEVLSEAKEKESMQVDKLKPNEYLKFLESIKIKLNQSSMPLHFDIPVLVTGFNRPEATEQVFRLLNAIQPVRLYYALDGPRQGRDDDISKIEKNKSLVSILNKEMIVKTRFRYSNLGLKKAMEDAIDWFFENEEMGIILEDDVLPDPSFFAVAKELLLKYKDTEHIHHIGGHNNLWEGKIGDGDYYLSRFNHCWGWASWRRAWKHYIKENIYLDEFFAEILHPPFINDQDEFNYFKDIYNQIKSGKLSSWAFIWTLSMWAAGAYAIITNVNMIRNIGIGTESTHTHGITPFARQPVYAISGLVHPTSLKYTDENKIADKFVFDYNYQGKIYNPNAIVSDIVSLINSNQSAEALTRTRRAILFYPELREIRFMHAVAMMKNEIYPESSVVLTELIKQFPDYKQAIDLNYYLKSNLLND